MADPIRAALERLLSDIQDLSDSSQGIVGLHRNGDPAPWNELLEGGRYSSWLGDAIEAARAALAGQQGEGTTLEEVEELLNRFAAFNIECLQGLINDALARWGHPALVPVAVSERPWEREGWCDDEGRCWCMSSLDGPPPRWWLVRPEPLSDGWVLPAHALPQGEV